MDAFRVPSMSSPLERKTKKKDANNRQVSTTFDSELPVIGFEEKSKPNIPIEKDAKQFLR